MVMKYRDLGKVDRNLLRVVDRRTFYNGESGGCEHDGIR